MTADETPQEVIDARLAKYEDVRPRCIFCGQPFTYSPTEPGDDFLARRLPTTNCDDPRTRWGHVEFWGSTDEQRLARARQRRRQPMTTSPAPKLALTPTLPSPPKRPPPRRTPKQTPLQRRQPTRRN